jgi:Amt family ammonium transporter
MALLFLVQAAGLVVAVGAMLGAALERGRILAMSVMAFLAGAVVYPLVANWIWGGGWLAALGRGFGLGNGVVDLAGAGVVHETAGALALAVALVLGSRQGRYNGKAFFIPGHNVPFTILGALLLLLAWTSANAFSPAGPSDAGATFATAAVNVLLGGVGGALATVFLNAWRRQRATPARLSRGLLGGAVALSSGSAFFDSWAALVTGLLAGLVVDGTMAWLDRKRVDDPAGATAVHGAAGAWGLVATGLFANGTVGRGLNAVDGPVRGLFFGGAWHQLAAQLVGVAVIFATAFALGGGLLLLLQKILGNRVRLADEIQGLDWPQVGALGYQPDVEPDEKA